MMQKGITLYSIEETIKSIPGNIKICFLSGSISGFLIHGFMLANKLPNGDDLVDINGYGGGGTFGRWLARFVHPLGSKWSVPWLNGSLFIFFLVLSACLIYAVLKFKSTLSAVMLPILIVSFPSVCSSIAYMFMADMYGISIFLVCLSAYLINRYERGWFVGIILTVLSLGLYQSYIFLEAAIFVVLLILALLRGKEHRQVFKEGIKYLLVLFSSVIFYIAIAKWRVPNMSSHNGYDTMGEINLSELPRNILITYRHVFRYFITKPMSFVNHISFIVNIICCILIALIIGGFIWSNIKNKKQTIGFYLLLSLLVMIFPLAIGGIYIVAPKASVSMIMLYQYVMVYVFLLSLWETSISPEYGFITLHRPKAILSISTFILIFTINYQNYVLTNEAYFRMDIAFIRANNFYNRVLVHLENVEGYHYGDKVALVGYVPESFGTQHGIDDDRFLDLSGIVNERGLSSQTQRSPFLRAYMGVYLPNLGWDYEQEYWEMEEYINMPIYPDEGSIKRFEDVWVIKLE